MLKMRNSTYMFPTTFFLLKSSFFWRTHSFPASKKFFPCPFPSARVNVLCETTVSAPARNMRRGIRHLPLPLIGDGENGINIVVTLQHSHSPQKVGGSEIQIYSPAINCRSFDTSVSLLIERRFSASRVGNNAVKFKFGNI